MIPRLSELAAFPQFWFVTMTPYGREIEPNVPDFDEAAAAFRALSKEVGIASVSWRYDPIFLTERYDLDFHIRSFGEMAAALNGYVDNCVISFIDLYAKTKRNFPKARQVTRQERETIGKEFVRIGKKNGIQIRTCCEGTELEKFGVDVAGCMTQAVIERAIGTTLAVPKRVRSPRSECNCLLGHDIGMYNTCAHGCVYCYANYNQATVQKNLALHDPASPFLIGGACDGDIIKDARQESYLDGQLSFFS
jgi:hypothetical protein